MSVSELIEQIKALPPAEREELRNFLLNGEKAAAGSGIRYASDDEFKAAADRVFEEHEELLRKLAQ